MMEKTPNHIQDKRFLIARLIQVCRPKIEYSLLHILPEHWQYPVSASTKKQFGIMKKLMQRKDVESLICATDEGRGGKTLEK